MNRILVTILILLVLPLSGCVTFSFTELLDYDASLVGTWRFQDRSLGDLQLSFRRDGTYEVDYNADGEKDIWGWYDYFLEYMKFTDDEPRVITDCYEAGFHKPIVSSRELSFEVFADQCKPRKGVLSNTFERVTYK